jgi:EF hand
MMNITKILIASSLLLCANLAQANHHEGAHEGCKDMKNMDFSMKDIDTNKDGDISKEEYAAAGQGDVDKNFKHMDANNDGKLDAKEQKDVEEVLKAMHSQKTKAPTATM